MSEPLEARLRRLEQERAEAHRLYNDALTAFDRALTPPGPLPEPPAEYDERMVPPLNDAWNILPAPPAGTGVTRRLTGFVWRTVAAIFERQLTFNARLIDHLNRNVRAHRESHRATVALTAALRDHAGRQAAIEASLVDVLQRITLLVDTKGRAEAETFNAALTATADTLGRRWESLRVGVGVAQQAALTIKRELERASLPAPAAAPRDERPAPSPDRQQSFGSRLEAYKYVGFEDHFRGSREAIRAGQASYLPLFEGRTDILDIGCGRGEFLDLLASRGIRARGLDLNPEMIEVCRARGLEATEADAVSYLSSLEDGALGGIFCAQVVEHLEPAYLLRFLELAFHKIAPGGPLVLETINPTCWVAFFESYIRDITHVRPLHPETLHYLVLASGFAAAALQFRAPLPDEVRLQPLDARAADDPRLQALAAVVNGNMEKLNARLFGAQDYAVIATR